ncbi:MAG TPA: histidine kinase dimerization/phosphoacceptor domain -containing protein [Spirochaetota bacterium]|nr:histidine kinase dimerization/phosphoacceptor domain -containing protein [Spirochaetota bacterium]
MKKLKIPVIMLLFTLIILLIILFRYVYNYDIIVTHLLYIPVILIAFLWQYRVIYVILIIGMILIASDISMGRDSFIIPDIIRLCLIMFTGIFVAVMRIYIIRLSAYRKYRDILFAVREPMAIVDHTFSVLINNEMFTSTFGIAVKGNILTLTGVMLNDEGPGDALSLCLGGTESVYQGRFMTLAGESRLFEIKCYPIGDDGGRYHAIMNFRDITEESEAAQKQKRALDRQNVAINILELLNSRDPGPGVIHEILNLVSETTGIGAIGLKLESGGTFNLYSSAGITVLTDYLRAECNDNDTTSPDHFCIRCLSSRLQQNSSESAAHPAEIFWTNDLDEYTLSSHKKTCRCMIAAGLKSAALMPVLSGDDVTGYFILLDRRKFFFNDELLEFFEGIVQSISIALDRVKYEEDLKQIINEKELLLREVHHRVKNNMQVITSLISLQASRQTDEYVKSILNECQNRVRTMALVHEKLYSSNNFTSINFGGYLNTLVPILMNSYRIEKDQVEVKITAGNIQLGLNTAIPLAQLVNEILSNVFKHAFPKGRRGSVAVELTRDSESGVNRLNISDTGTGMAEGISFPEGGNLGFQLIEALVKQIRGTISFSGNNGVLIQVEF